MKLVGDLWCPDVMSGPHAYLRRSKSLDAQIALCPQKRTCVQAGGHIGIYPTKLAQHFERVYTFEPEPENFICLQLNTRKLKNVLIHDSFLGSDFQNRDLHKHSKSTGGHQTGFPNRTGIPTATIDAFQFMDLDAIFLDVEGFEMEILKGALATIARCRPLLVLEENGKGKKYGGVRIGDLELAMRPYGYKLLATEGEDIVLGINNTARNKQQQDLDASLGP